MEEEEDETDPTESTVLQIKFVAYSVIAYIIVGVGIVGNLLNLVVLTRPNLKGVMYVYLLGLAVSNLCVLLSAVPALFDIAGGGLAGAGAYPTAFYQAHLELPLINAFMASSVYIIICMTVNRYISIYRPTQFQRVHTHKNARISIAASFLGGIVLHIPLCFQNRVDPYDCTITNKTTVISTGTTSSFSLRAVLHFYDEIESNNDSASNHSLKNTTTTMTTSVISCQWRSDENFLVSETYLFKIYLIVSEILLRVGPILILGVLNALIISKFTKIAKKRHALKGGGAAAANGNIKPEASSMLSHHNEAHSTAPHSSSPPSSPFPSRTTSSTNPSSSSGPSSTSCSSSSGPRLLVPGAGNGGMLSPVCSRSPSPEPSSAGSGDCASPALDHHQSKHRHHHHRRRRHKNRSLQSPEERMLVVVLISIVVLFVCCTTPAAVLSILYTARLNRHLGFQIFRAVANNLELVNFALNFYIYCLCSAEIRRAFVQVGRGLWRAVSCYKRRRRTAAGREITTRSKTAVTVRIEQV
jgi:hypothetical protein